MGSCMKASHRGVIDAKKQPQMIKHNVTSMNLASHKKDYYQQFENLSRSFQDNNQGQYYRNPYNHKQISQHRKKNNLNNIQIVKKCQRFNQSSRFSSSSVSQTQSLITIVNNNNEQKNENKSNIISYGIREITSCLKNQGIRNKAIDSFVETLTNPIESQISQSLRTLSQIQLDKINQLINNVSFICKNPIESYYFKKQIEKGGACFVYEIVKIGAPKQQQHYVAKIFSQNTPEFVKKIKLQIAIMRIVQSNNVVSFKFAYFFKEKHYIIMEHMVHGSLTNLLKKAKQIHYQTQSKSPTILSEKLISYILRQILKGLIYIHSSGVVHRDIKSDNILMGQNGCVKIGDFGHATLAVQQYLSTDQIVGTPAWMAPQLIKKTGYNELIDIWSLGIVAIQLCLGEPPYLRLNPIKSMYMIVTQQPPKVKGVSSSLQNFISLCLQKNPFQRLPAYNLLKHPFINNEKFSPSQKQQLNLLLGLSDRYRLSQLS